MFSPNRNARKFLRNQMDGEPPTPIWGYIILFIIIVAIIRAVLGI